eukprot:COSAG05_NODE_846_length_6998_cov_2.530077_8_plen_62_part_00
MRAIFQSVISRRFTLKIITHQKALFMSNNLISYELFSGDLGPVRRAPLGEALSAYGADWAG